MPNEVLAGCVSPSPGHLAGSQRLWTGHIECDGASDPKWRMVGESTAQALHWPQASQLKWSQSRTPLLHDPPTGRLLVADGEVTAAKLVAIGGNGLTVRPAGRAGARASRELLGVLRSRP